MLLNISFCILFVVLCRKDHSSFIRQNTMFITVLKMCLRSHTNGRMFNQMGILIQYVFRMYFDSNSF